MIKILWISVTVVFIYSCAPARFVKPLQDKQHAVNLSVGGPLIDYNDLTIPMPFFTAIYGYGINNTLTGFAGVNITSAFYGNIQLELGATKQLWKQNGYIPAVSVAPIANFIYRDKDAKKLYPQLDVIGFWEYNRNRNYFYGGISNWFELSGKKAHDQEQKNYWLITPLIGQTFVRQKWDFSIEAKVIAPHLSYESNVVEYKSPFGKNGAFGIYLGYTRKF